MKKALQALSLVVFSLLFAFGLAEGFFRLFPGFLSEETLLRLHWRGIIDQPVDAKVDVTELMGNEIFVYMTTGEHTFVARVDPRSRYHMGDEARMVFNMDNMHIFDRETEVVIR